MTLIDQARHLLTCDELRGRVPDEVAEFLREVAALEPVAKLTVKPSWQPKSYASPISSGSCNRRAGEYPLYTLETSHDAG